MEKEVEVMLVIQASTSPEDSVVAFPQKEKNAEVPFERPP